MLWLLAFVVVVIFWFLFPPFRYFALAIGVLLVGLVTVLILYVQHEDAVSRSLIPASQVELTDLRLGEQYGSYQITGEVKNNSEHYLSSVHLKVRAFDCPASSITPSCTTIGQDDNVSLGVGVPPHQVRAVDHAYVSFYGMPKI